MNQIFIFHHHDYAGNNTRMAPSAYYIDADYIPIACRIYAETAPSHDAEVDIYDDGVSIFQNRASTLVHPTTGVITRQSAKTSATLMADTNEVDLAGNFKDETIEEGSWLYCNLVDGGDGKNFTVQLEVETLYAEDEPL